MLGCGRGCHALNGSLHFVVVCFVLFLFFRICLLFVFVFFFLFFFSCFFSLCYRSKLNSGENFLT